MSNPIEIANDIKAAILELAGGRDYPDLLEAVDSLLIRSSNKGYAQGVIDGKAIGPESGEQLYRRIATYEGIGKIVATYEPVTCPAPAQAPEPSSAVKASDVVAHRLMRRNGDGKWVNDAKHWTNGLAPYELLRDVALRPNLYRIENAYGTLAQAPEPSSAPKAVDREAFEAAYMDRLGLRMEDYDFTFNGSSYADDDVQTGWWAWNAALATKAEQRGAGKADDWEIDNSTPSPILTYKKCSVIQDEQAHWALTLIRSALHASDDMHTAYQKLRDAGESVTWGSFQSGWVGAKSEPRAPVLTDEQIRAIYVQHWQLPDEEFWLPFARAILAASTTQPPATKDQS